MTFEIKPYPEFAWSISRQRKLDQCPRGYFYTYYLHWNGWLDDAPTEARVAYRLGKLTSLDALLGQQIDVRARELEAAARAGRELPSADELELRTREALRKAWTRSRNGRTAFEQRPSKVVMLRSLYLEQDTQPETDRLNEKAAPSPWPASSPPRTGSGLRSRGDAGRVEVPDFASFAHDGVKVFAAPDLAYIAGAARCTSSTGRRRVARTTPGVVLLQMWWALETYPALARAAADGDLEVRGYLEYVARRPHPARRGGGRGRPRGSPGAVRRVGARRGRPDARPARRPGAATSRWARPPSSAARAGSARWCSFGPICA